MDEVIKYYVWKDNERFTEENTWELASLFTEFPEPLGRVSFIQTQSAEQAGFPAGRHHQVPVGVEGRKRRGDGGHEL